MHQPTYPILYSEINQSYVFISRGKDRNIIKIVSFTELQPDVFSLGFGDYDPAIKSVSDKVVSDNGDMVKVLATVVSLIDVFTQNNPTAWVHFEGSTPERTRLYRIVIDRYFEDFSQLFEILGQVNENSDPEPFQKNNHYESFLIRRML